MRRMPLLAAVTLFLALFTLFLGACKRPEVKVPINISHAASVGSLHFEVVYDSDSFSAVAVDKSASFADALLEYDIASPGHVVVGVISSKGLSGEDTLATVTLQAKKGDPFKTIDVANVVANSARDMSDLPASVSPGEAAGKTSTAAVIKFIDVTE